MIKKIYTTILGLIILLGLGFIVFDYFASCGKPEPKGYVNFGFNVKTGYPHLIVTYDGYKCKEE